MATLSCNKCRYLCPCCAEIGRLPTKRMMVGRKDQQTGSEPLSASWPVTIGAARCGEVAVWRSCSAVKGYNTEVSDDIHIVAFWVVTFRWVTVLRRKVLKPS